jgi:very-short-patch-repair endonuclease
MRISGKYDALMKQRARRLRRELTEAERILWWHLRRGNMRGLHFRRQQPFGPYVLDFYCHHAQLAIELDGTQHGEEVQRWRDRDRDQYLSDRGVRVLRFRNGDVFSRLSDVLREIDRALSRESPLPVGEG